MRIDVSFSPPNSNALAAILPFLLEFENESDAGVTGEIRESDVDGARAAVEAAGSVLVERQSEDRPVSDFDPSRDVLVQNYPEVVLLEVGEIPGVAPVDETVEAPVENPTNLAFVFRLTGAAPEHLVEQGIALCRAFSGSAVFAEPPTGWEGDAWCVSGTVGGQDALVAAASVLDVSYTCTVDGEVAFGGSVRA